MAFAGHVTIADTGPIFAGSSGPTTLDVLSGTGGNPVVFGDHVTVNSMTLPAGITVLGSLTGVANYTNSLTVNVASFVTPGIYNIPFSWVDVETPSKFGSDSFNVDVQVPPIDLDANILADSDVVSDLGVSTTTSSDVTADSSVFANGGFLLNVAAPLVSDSATVGNTRFLLRVGAVLVSDSSAVGDFNNDPTSLFADSSIALDLHAHYHSTSGLVAGASLAADARLHETLHASLLAGSSISFKTVHVTTNIVGDSSFTSRLSGPVRITAALAANSFLFPGQRLHVSAGLTATSSIFADFNDDPTSIFANSTITADLSFAVTGLSANILADSNVNADLPDQVVSLYFHAVAVSPTKIRLLFPDGMLNDENLNSISSYEVTDASGNDLGVLSVTPEDPPEPTSVALVLSAPLVTAQNYSVTVSTLVQLAAGGPLSPNRTGFYWLQEAGTPIILQLGEFTGEVEGGLFGNPDGQVFFSPALNVAAANSVIQVEEVDVCTYAFDTYTFPQPIDPVSLFTFGAGRPPGSVLGPGGAVLWAPFPRNMEAMFELGFSPALTNDIMPQPDDVSVTALFRATWDITYVALLNDPAWRLYAEQVVVPGTPPLFITANNAGPIPFGGETLLIVRMNLNGQSSLSAVLSDVVALHAHLVTNSFINGDPVEAVLGAGSSLTASITVV